MSKQHGPTWLVQGENPDQALIHRAIASLRDRMGCMPCVSIRQPYAGALVAGVKTHENRKWSPRDLIKAEKAGKVWWCAIHAGSEWYRDDVATLDEVCEDVKELWPAMPSRQLLVRGAVVGAVAYRRVVQVVNQSDEWRAAHPWACGPKAWEVADAIQLEEPMSYRGAQGIFQLDVVTADRVRAAWKARA